MAIIDNFEKDNLIGKWDDSLKMWVEPPRVNELSLTVKVNPLSIAALLFIEDRAVIDNWIKQSPTLQAFFAVGERELNCQEIKAFEQVVKDDRDDIDNPLTEDVANKLLDLLTTLRAGVKDPDA